MSRSEYSDSLMEHMAERFRVLAEPVRLRLLNALRAGERTVTQLVADTGATQANVSRHLALLHQHHMVARRKEGLHVYYRIADPTIFQLCDLVCGGLAAGLEEELRSLGSR
jgi:DNA-binding transcriptional ArsR family regulator